MLLCIRTPTNSTRFKGTLHQKAPSATDLCSAIHTRLLATHLHNFHWNSHLVIYKWSRNCLLHTEHSRELDYGATAICNCMDTFWLQLGGLHVGTEITPQMRPSADTHLKVVYTVSTVHIHVTHSQTMNIVFSGATLATPCMTLQQLQSSLVQQTMCQLDVSEVPLVESYISACPPHKPNPDSVKGAPLK